MVLEALLNSETMPAHQSAYQLHASLPPSPYPCPCSIQLWTKDKDKSQNEKKCKEAEGQKFKEGRENQIVKNDSGKECSDFKI